MYLMERYTLPNGWDNRRYYFLIRSQSKIKANGGSKMDYGLQGKIALVTGTGSQTGMGKAVCLRLAQEGCDIISASRDFEGAKQTAAEVKALGRKAIALKVDVSRSAEVNEMVKEALQEFGKIEILVNAAGLIAVPGKSFMETDPAVWEKDLAVNLFGTMNCAKAVISGMVERKYGKIINYSSITAKAGGADSYSISKAAVLAFTRGLASQFGPSNINVNAIAPGMVKTKLFGPIGEAESQRFERWASRPPLRRIQTVEDMANTTAFLASDVSKNITGQCIQVDSGLVMW
jgi:NAD(P)-dependent dehydrogenase (short-subunit alcohol dehydrogenase family)